MSQLHIAQLVEVACAMHLTSYVEGPFTGRGGLMLVGPPGVLKSTVIQAVRAQYFDTLLISDLNLQTLVQMRDTLASGGVRTLLLPELAKLYERHPTTAQNVEGHLRALAEEGFSNASFEDQRINSINAKATIIGAMTPSLYRKWSPHWWESGFSRRFLWSLLTLENPHELETAVVEWERIDFRVGLLPPTPLGGQAIPNRTTREERSELQRLVRDQPGDSHPLHLQMVTKLLAVLKWWYPQRRQGGDPMTTLRHFARSLGQGGAQVSLQGLPVKKVRNGKRPPSPHAAGAALAKRRWRKGK